MPDATVDVGADDRVRPSSMTSGFRTAYRPTTEWSTRAVVRDAGPVVQHRGLEHRARLDDRARAEHRRRAPRAPASIRRAGAEQHRRLDTVAPGSIVASPCVQMPSDELARAGRRAGRPTRPRSTSMCACRYFSGVPMSSQYASVR